MSSVLYMTATTAIVQVGTRRDMHGRLLALQTMLMLGTTLIGGPISGWLADLINTRAPIIFGGIVCLVSAAFGYLTARKYALKP